MRVCQVHEVNAANALELQQKEEEENRRLAELAEIAELKALQDAAAQRENEIETKTRTQLLSQDETEGEDESLEDKDINQHHAGSVHTGSVRSTAAAPPDSVLKLTAKRKSSHPRSASTASYSGRRDSEREKEREELTRAEVKRYQGIHSTLAQLVVTTQQQLTQASNNPDHPNIPRNPRLTILISHNLR